MTVTLLKSTYLIVVYLQNDNQIMWYTASAWCLVYFETYHMAITLNYSKCNVFIYICLFISEFILNQEFVLKRVKIQYILNYLLTHFKGQLWVQPVYSSHLFSHLPKLFIYREV